MFFQFFKYFAVITILNPSIRSQKTNPLSGKHVRVMTIEFPVSLEVKRNASGHVIGFDGVLTHHIAALSRMLRFSYSYLPNVTTTMGDHSTSRGGMYYLLSDEADFLLSTGLANPSRFKDADLPASWYNGPFGLIVPYPQIKMDLKASFKPFSYQTLEINKVWIAIGIATLTIMLCLRISSMKCWIQQWQHSRRTFNSITNNDSSRIAYFVWGNLVSQGQSFNSNRLVVRTAAGAWCCGCFFLVQIYCSTLSSYLISPNQKPIVETLKELANTPGVDLTVDRGFGLHLLLQTMETGVYRRLADKLKRNINLQCNVTADCLAIVKEGYATYGAPIDVLKAITARDLKTAGFCNYYLTREKFLSTDIFNLLPKNSPYTEIVSIGILRLQQFGFYDKWFSWYLPEPRKCMELERQKVTPRLSITHLSSAFVILIAGYIISTIAFALEKVVHISAHVLIKA